MMTSGSSTIEDELWKIFTKYSVQSNPLDPSVLPQQQCLRLVREVQLQKRSAQVQLIVSSQLRHGCTTGLNFQDFLEVLARLAGNQQSEIAKLLLEHVLPLAPRRHIIPIEKEFIATRRVFHHFKLGLDKIFDSYATLAEETWRKNVSSAAARSKPNPKSTTTPPKIRAIGYREFLIICENCKLFHGPASKIDALLSVADIADAYLAATPPPRKGIEPCVSDLTRPLFDQALLRLALKAFNDKLHDPERSLQALFLYMWQANSSSHNAMHFREAMPTGRSGLSKGASYKSDFLNLKGSALFNSTFVKMWQAHNFDDYASVPPPPPALAGLDLLDNIVDHAVHLTPSKDSLATEDYTLPSDKYQTPLYSYDLRHQTPVHSSFYDATPSTISTSFPRQSSPVVYTDNNEAFKSDRRRILRVSEISALLGRRPDIADFLYHSIKEAFYEEWISTSIYSI